MHQGLKVAAVTSTFEAASDHISGPTVAFIPSVVSGFEPASRYILEIQVIKSSLVCEQVQLLAVLHGWGGF